MVNLAAWMTAFQAKTKIRDYVWPLQIQKHLARLMAILCVDEVLPTVSAVLIQRFSNFSVCKRKAARNGGAEGQIAIRTNCAILF